MKILHRIGFNRLDKVDQMLDNMAVKYKKIVLPGDGYVLYFDIDESDVRWPRIFELVQEKGASDIYNTVFTEAEILASEWIRLMPVFEQGYPQPEDNWKEATYKDGCPKCGAGYTQKAPFRLAGEPRMGRNHFLCLFWTYSLFCIYKLKDDLTSCSIRGYESWPALLHPSGQPSGLIWQMVVPSLAGPSLDEGDKLKPETCLECGIIKYDYHHRGYMRLKREALKDGVDCQLTNEWFGSGSHAAYREFLISNRFARLIIEKRWRGVTLKPVELV